MMESSFSDISENYKRITEQIYTAAEIAGQRPEFVTLLAATKTVEPEKINYAISLGLKAIGENRVQELMDKYDALKLAACDCQFIGKLQTNKVKYLTDKVSVIQSIDNLGQLREISKRMNGKEMKVLIEVNIGHEPEKGGVSPDILYEFIDEARSVSGIHISGLMTIPPVCENNSELCNYFCHMRQSFIDIRAKKMDNVSMNILSMGMSCDFSEAIACGANMVRIGSALFGKRNN